MRRKFISDTPMNAVFTPSIQLRKDDIIDVEAHFNPVRKAYDHFLILADTKYLVTQRTYGRILDQSIAL